MNKVNRIINYIKSSGEFGFDVDEVVENFDTVLASYDIYEFLSNEEYFQLMEEIMLIAEQMEIAEAELWASQKLICGQDLRLGSDYRIPSSI